MTGANAVDVRDVVVDHHTAAGRVRALECTGLGVDPGTSLAIMGPSGCGKSTLLGLLAGLAVPTRGIVEIGGVTVSDMSEPDRIRFRRATIGMVYQADNLLPHLTVEENVGLQTAICRSEADAGTEPDPGALLRRLGLGGLATRLPDQLSGGQRQRVAVARAVIHRPNLILADEPTGSLDAENAQAVMELLLDVHRQIKATLVIVTHDPMIAAYVERTVQLARPCPEMESAHVV